MSEIVKTWTDWLENSRFSYMSEVQKQQTLRWLFNVRDHILDRAKLKSNDTLIDIGTGTGLLGFGAYEQLKETGKVIMSDAFADCLEQCGKIAEKCGIQDKIEFLQSDAADIKLPDNSVDVVVMRSVLAHILNKSKPVQEFYRILKKNGRISIFEPIIRKNTKYYELIEPENFPNYEKIKEIEQKMSSDENDPLVNFDENTLGNDFLNAGFKNVNIIVSTESSTYEVDPAMIDPWFNTPPSPGRPNLKQRFIEFMSEKEVNEFIENLRFYLGGKTITLNSPVAYVYAEK
ncbi:MAG TPA: methyltransferase domain-containing protein [Candidatus Gastranaerophilales bacterium]|nr:methyltransferase domain-containing protein [Candidatus Gastranaerophilales bacterium]